MINNEEQEYLENRGLIGIAFKQMHLYFRTQDDYQDYTDAGTDGLLRGIRTFDENKGVKKSTYYYTCIRNEIHTKIVEKNRLKNQRHVSLNQIANDLDGTELMDFIPSEYDLEEEVKKKINGEKVISIINTLNPREQYIVKSKYGIDKHQKKTIQAIANELGLSHQRVHVIYNNAISKIYKKLKVVNDEY